jgi:hypothetical protein
MDEIELPQTTAYRLPGSAAVTARRVITRFAVMLIVLVAVDLVVSATFAAEDYENDWRMPRALPTSRIVQFIAHIERPSAADTAPVVAFLGASPTWGDAVREDRETVSAAYRRAATADDQRLRAYNLASNGQLLGDAYFIAQRVADDTNLLMVQLTYHGFNGAWREGAARRYPELSDLLGVPIDDELAVVLGTEPAHRPDLTGTADRWLQRRWALYGMRDAIAGEVLGATPERRLFQRWETLASPEFAGEEERIPSGEPFEMLEPDEQMIVLDEFAAAGEFQVDPDDSEVLMLERLASDLAESGTRTVFYISPLNVEALESFDLFDRELYEENVGPLREIVESRGHLFLDLNEDARIPASAFADINHTTAEGSELVAAELWRLTRNLIEVAP